MAASSAKKTDIKSFNRMFQFIQLDISNVKVIQLLSDKNNKIESFKELLKPFIKIIIESITTTVFVNYNKSLTMELRNDFIIIDCDYKPISDIVPFMSDFFKAECDIETDQRITQYLKTCQINLKDFGCINYGYYYFFFMINRKIFPFNLCFIGCKYIEESTEIIFINDLMTKTVNSEKIHSSNFISERKKQKKIYEDKLIFYDTIQ